MILPLNLSLLSNTPIAFLKYVFDIMTLSCHVILRLPGEKRDLPEMGAGADAGAVGPNAGINIAAHRSWDADLNFCSSGPSLSWARSSAAMPTTTTGTALRGMTAPHW